MRLQPLWSFHALCSPRSKINQVSTLVDGYLTINFSPLATRSRPQLGQLFVLPRLQVRLDSSGLKRHSFLTSPHAIHSTLRKLWITGLAGPFGHLVLSF